MKFTFLGGVGEVGRSGVLVDSEGKRFMLDYGIKVYEGGPAQLPLVPQKRIHEVVISHAHLDHIGFLPMIYERNNARWYGTPPTHALGDLLIKDAMKVQRLNGFENPFTEESFNQAMDNFYALSYGESVHMKSGPELTLHDAGHILGAAMIDLYFEGKRVLYTGDYNLTDTRMHKGASFNQDVDILITESTYAEKEHPNRKEEEKRLIQNVERAIEYGGSALVPVFAVGRSQEVLSILNEAFPDIPMYLDGMAIKASDIYLRYPEYIRNPESLHSALHRSVIVRRINQRKRAVRGQSIIVSPAGMLNGGHVLWYLEHLPPNSTITLTGYVAEGTNGWLLLNKGYVVIDGHERRYDYYVDQVDLSAHAGRHDLLGFIKKTTPELVIVMHGDNCYDFADELQNMGFSAIAPRMGETIPIVK